MNNTPKGAKKILSDADILAQLNRIMSESVDGPAAPARTPARVPEHILARSRRPAPTSAPAPAPTPVAAPAPARGRTPARAPGRIPAHILAHARAALAQEPSPNIKHTIPVRSNIAHDVVTQYDAAIFFDNEQKHIDDMPVACPTITVIKVPDTHPKPKPPFNESPFKEYLASLGENTYINVLKRQGETYDAYDQASGLASTHVDRLRAWIEETADKASRVALFDWDRTFTKVEGIFPYESEAAIRTIIPGLSWTTFVRDATRYLCGGAERVQLLKDMFVTLHANHVDIAILTNNGGCPDRVALMRAILVELLPPGAQATIYCSAPAPYAGNKGKRLQDAAKFKRLCPPQAGGRRTRRRTIRRKSTRRHRKH
jgi:hypothetical protein